RRASGRTRKCGRKLDKERANQLFRIRITLVEKERFVGERRITAGGEIAGLHADPVPAKQRLLTPCAESP
ncbi:MAG: hypothetical protein RBT81_12930, partial [Gammaproteobacteria bacterium]|nr:hypothetical protein [Gammaproteobacteria bacterium]